MGPIQPPDSVADGVCMRYAKSTNRHTGYTLVELMIVIVILGILAALVVPRFGTASDQAQFSSTLQQLKIVRQQVNLFRNEMGRDPDMTDWSEMITEGYLKMAPQNPHTNSTSIVGAAAAGEGWVWRAVGGGNPRMELYAIDSTGAEMDETEP